MSAKTLVKRVNGQVIYKADTEVDIPELDLLTLLFGSKHCSAQEDAPLHIDAANPSLSLTKAQARSLTKRIAHALRREHGVGVRSGKKDYVTCISAGNYIVPCIFYGVVAAGGIFSSVTASSTVGELERLIKLAPSELVICSEETKEVSIKAAEGCEIPLDRVLVIDPQNKALRRASDSKNILTDQELDWRKITDRQVLELTPVCLIYSSGTTGLPKGVPLSHRNMVSEVIISCDPIKKTMDYDYRTLAHLPIAHIAGMQGYFVNPFYMGGPTYWMSKFDFAKFLEYNKKYAITFFFTVPPIYLLIAKSPAVTDQFKTLRMAISGAAPMGKELQEAASKRLGEGKTWVMQTWVMQTWGLSENTGSATLFTNGDQDNTGSVSRLLPNCSARIVDDDGKDVQPGDEGEILLRGPIVFRGYHNNPTANADAFDGPWFRTGDVAIFKNNMFYIVDRKKELIKYKGIQVAPAELEALLLSHPAILDAAVIGVEVEGTEVPRAYVVGTGEGRVSAQEVMGWVRERVAGYKQLRGGVIFVDAIPKSPSGKILRKDLRAMAKREVDGRARL